MRSRSSRLFIVLLHLVGVSTNLPRRLLKGVGIVGVHPMAILLERLSLEDFEDGLDGLLRAAQEDQEDRILAEPFWLQDDEDGKCLGPAGFSECGDATLWLLRRAPRGNPRHRRLWQRLFQRPESDLGQPQGYALQLVDIVGLQEQGEDNQSDNNNDVGECLIRQKDSRPGLSSCSRRQKAAWTWRINAKGVLSHEPVQTKLRLAQAPSQQQQQGHLSMCLSRAKVTAAVLSPCQHVARQLHAEDEERERPGRRVHFSLVRYQVTTPTTPAVGRMILPRASNSVVDQEGVEDDDVSLETVESDSTSLVDHLPTTVDKAHSHATGPAMFPDLKPASQLLFSRPLGSSNHKITSSPSPIGSALLKGASPLLLAGSTFPRGGDTLKETKTASTAPSAATTRPHKVRIPSHPYIAAAKDERWTDPQTGLEYLTDLCEYLGHDRRETGRHTLVGVGQYLRTVFNIKVYGVAMYVSRRDVLADPSFEKYANLPAEELRTDPAFYRHLREMPSSTDPNGGMFDRTLLVKLNMQLSTDTMRSSLHADWKMLTDENKDLLINSSLQPRPADDNMLETVQSEDNPGRCSCGQIAPEEYNADSSCCARGTELVFTWRRNGDLEARLDGRIMDIFARPDVAEGIFFEYLRHDDPISPDFVNHVVDGFPFLLAPLASVKGVSMVHPSAPLEEKVGDRGLMKGIGGLVDIVSSQTDTFTTWVHGGATGMASQVRGAAEFMGVSARTVGEEMDRRRMQLWNQVSSLPEASMNFVVSRLNPNRRAVSIIPESEDAFRDPRLNFSPETPRMKQGPRGRLFRFPMTRWLGEDEILLDEIEPIIHSTTNFTRNMCLTMVHFYLLLLLVVSFPGSQGTRTRLVVRRSKDPNSDTDSDSTAVDYSPRKSDPEPWCTGEGELPSMLGETKQARRLLRIARRRQTLQSEEP